jgi:SAM-dependent methyltransferase
MWAPSGGSKGEDRGAEIVYDAMASAYDDFTAAHDYDLWVGELLELARLHGVPGGAVLDIACGTGKSFLPMLERGWDVMACDISAAMVRIARSKVGTDVPIEVADMRALPIMGSFDLVCALDDAANYLLTPEELEMALQGMAANMRPDGLLIFDANTLNVYRNFFAEHVETEANGRRLIWDGRSDGKLEPGGIAEATFEVEAQTPEAGQSIAPVLHRQRHHPEEEVRAALAAAGLEMVGLYGHDFSGIPHTGVSEDVDTKAIYVSRRAPTAQIDADP